MLRRLISTMRETEKRLSKSYGRDISSPAGRRQAFWHYHLSDHGFLRVLWTNLFEIAPGVWRSNQPSAARVRRYRRMGIKAILNLRGEEPFSFFLFEREAAEAQGIEMTNVRLSARRLASPERMQELFDAFDAMPKPFVMHCKSGADRAGLASALWLMDQEGLPVAVARQQLHWRYAHLKGTSTGILDYLLDAFEADTARSPMPVRVWFQRRYDRVALTAAWEAGIPAATAMAEFDRRLGQAVEASRSAQDPNHQDLSAQDADRQQPDHPHPSPQDSAPQDRATASDAKEPPRE